MKLTKLNDAKWLSNPDDISTASNDSLLRGLLTADGKGSEFKMKLLQELESRIRSAEFSVIRYVTD